MGPLRFIATDQQSNEDGSRLGDGARLALEIVADLCREFQIDEHRIYVTGQSMGGAGTYRPRSARAFAAAVACCSPTSTMPPSIATPGIFTETPTILSPSRCRATASLLEKGGRTSSVHEYARISHNVWRHTEPELIKWLFSKSRG